MSQPVILVVEDIEHDQDVLSHLLSKFDFLVKVARSSDEAILAVREQKFAVILMDLAMPGVDSFECMRQIKQIELDSSSQTPIIALGGHGVAEKEALAAGMDGYISKPFNPEDLRRVLLRFAYEPRRPNLKTLRPLPPEDLEIGTI